jgi:hypothetical protein
MSGAVGGGEEGLGAKRGGDGVGGQVVPVVDVGDVGLDEFAEDVAVEEKGVFALGIVRYGGLGLGQGAGAGLRF